MSVGGSSNQSRTSGLTGPGALSHVYIQYPPMRCNVPGARALFYDDGNKLVLAPTSDGVYSWKIGLHLPHERPNFDLINSGPIISIRYSLDGKVIGIHRSNHEIEFKNRETGAVFYGKCKSGSESILGFFWTDCPACDVVIIKTSAVDLYVCEPDSNALCLVETKRLYTSWYLYTHETRLVLLASGMQCKNMAGYQFSSAGVIRLPKFEMTMTKAEANKKPVLSVEDVHIITVYGRIYCLQVDSVGMLLRIYRFYRDAVMEQGSVPIYSTKAAVSVVDNVLIVHQVDAKVVLLYDMFSDSRAPFSAPLPLLVRGLPALNSSASQTGSKRAELLSELSESNTDSNEGKTYGESWSFLTPDLISDSAHGVLWRVLLDLEAIATSSSDVPLLLEFLQRRRSEPSKVKELCLALIRTMILERRPVSMVARAIDVLTVSYGHDVKSRNSLRGSGKAYFEGSFASEQGGSSTPGVKCMDAAAAKHDQPTVHDLHGRIMEADVLHPNQESSSTSDNDEGLLHLETLNLKSQSTSTAPPNYSSNYTADGEHEIGSETIHVGPWRTPLQPDANESCGNLISFSSQKPQITSVAISPEEMYNSVFVLVEEQMNGDLSYLVSIVVECLRSLSVEKLKVSTDLYVLAIQLLARNERYSELGQFIRNQIFEPSAEVALQLLATGNLNSPIHKLGVDMLRQLSLHNDYILVLLHDGYYLEALRYARRNKVYTIRPSLFLEAAVSSNDPQRLASVLHFFLDFRPEFKTTNDYSTFSKILNEMTGSVTSL